MIISWGQEVARLVPPEFAITTARDRLVELRLSAEVGDVLSPLDEPWAANV